MDLINICHADQNNCMHECACVHARVCVCVCRSFHVHVCVCAFVSGRRYTGCHCLCGRVVEEEVAGGETQDKESERWEDTVSVCVCMCVSVCVRPESCHHPSLRSVLVLGCEGGLSLSFCHNMSHQKDTQRHTRKHTHTLPEEIMSRWGPVAPDQLIKTPTRNLSTRSQDQSLLRRLRWKRQGAERWCETT